MYLKEIDYSLRNETLIDKLTIIWQKSVEATHLFLSPQDIKDILPQVVIGLKQIPILLVSFTDDDEPIGFAGIADDKLEMLFLSPDYFQQGIGYKMISTAIQDCQIKYVDVNEQNPKALKFYLRQGFTIFKRSPVDSDNRPFPILHLKK
ncbi:GNAT family N-acetyltransferase [Megamonas funiformis]|uniref:GNAT family N-acetyltransferase n=1 Tax=Megamonas funiformis TaxID=437897 RepID=UPI0026DB3DEF|nr:GNAT family N-acetyltransferase [Megamonas funiformis]